MAAVHLCDAHYITDASKYLSVLLLSLRAMLQLELPHINILSKIDLLAQYGELGKVTPLVVKLLIEPIVTDFNLDFYTEVQDLSHLENSLSSSLPPRFAALNMSMISLIEDFALLGFETLAVEDKDSMLNLTRVIDKATGYIFIPPPTASGPTGTVGNPMEMAPSARPNTYSLFTTAVGPMKGPSTDVRHIQERWIDARETYDAYERREWRKEGEIIRDAAAK